MRLNIFRRKKKILRPPRAYAIIRFTPEAKELCVGGVNNMKILVFQGRLLTEVYDFSMKRIEQLERRGIPVVAQEYGELPPECKVERPDIYYTFGKLRFK